MANRQVLALLRQARAGDAQSQFVLGRHYASGSEGLPRSLPTALHWLARAAAQGMEDAWQMIGSAIPLEVAQPRAAELAPWYALAWEAGNVEAGLVLAQLAFGTPWGGRYAAQARAALERGAREGLPEASWLLIQYAGHYGIPAGVPLAKAAPEEAPARGGAHQRAWSEGRHRDYLELALPEARSIARDWKQGSIGVLPTRHAVMLSRCARLVQQGLGKLDEEELEAMWEAAADGRDAYAEYQMGLRCARMDEQGVRTVQEGSPASFRKALRWLEAAGAQGLADAYVAMARIYLKPEFSQRCVATARRMAEQAATMGHAGAQLECGNIAWRSRRGDSLNEMQALYWWQKAANQGCAESAANLDRVAPPLPAEQVVQVPPQVLGMARHGGVQLVLLAARLELAQAFGLSRAEMLMIDPSAADHGHCMVIDIRHVHGRSKRRLVMVREGAQRELLERVKRLFLHVDCGMGGLEGNYRQRLYRLARLLEQAGVPPSQQLEMAA
jgi:TPR repeat protein